MSEACLFCKNFCCYCFFGGCQCVYVCVSSHPPERFQLVKDQTGDCLGRLSCPCGNCSFLLCVMLCCTQSVTFICSDIHLSLQMNVTTDTDPTLSAAKHHAQKKLHLHESRSASARDTADCCGMYLAGPSEHAQACIPKVGQMD